MTLQSLISDVMFNSTMRTVTLGSTLLGIVSGAIGSYAVLRKQSLLGDTISHAAFPGVILAFMITGSRAPLYIILGAAVVGWLATVMIMALIKNSKIKNDSALGIGLSLFFGMGIVLLSYVQNADFKNKAGLDKILFGQTAAIQVQDVWITLVLGLLILLLISLFWKEFKLLSFDSEFAKSIGLPVRILDGILMTALVLAIVLGLQTVGVVLMSAMIVAPAAAARQWTEKLGVMIILSSVIGALSGALGVAISRVAEFPPGPTIVVVASVFVIISLFFAPNRGILWKALRQISFKKQIQLDTLLYDFYGLALHHDNPHHPHTLGTLKILNANPMYLRQALTRLEELGYVQYGYALTEKGLAKAREFDRKED